MTKAEKRDVILRTRAMVVQTLPVQEADEDSALLARDGFAVQILFSQAHPLVALYYSRPLAYRIEPETFLRVNQLNLNCVTGAHLIDGERGLYAYRAVQELERVPEARRFLAFFLRHLAEARRGYGQL